MRIDDHEGDRQEEVEEGKEDARHEQLSTLLYAVNEAVDEGKRAEATMSRLSNADDPSSALVASSSDSPVMFCACFFPYLSCIRFKQGDMQEKRSFMTGWRPIGAESKETTVLGWTVV